MKFAFLLFLIQSTCVFAGPMIVGGISAAGDEQVVASTVMLVARTSEGEALCSGSILAADIVITAAHCLTAKPEDMQIRFAHDEAMEVDSYIVHPKADIGLIRLLGKIPSGYRPATLLSDSLVEGEDAVLAGYGITNAKTQYGAGTLREVVVKVEKSLGRAEVILDQSMGRGACHGDSGGPAFASRHGKLLLWGVTSRAYPGTADDDCKQGSVYTSITAYISWVNQSLKTL